MNLLNGLGGVLLVRKADERETTWASAVSVFWNVDVGYFTNLAEQFTELFVRGAEIEISYEYLV